MLLVGAALGIFLVFQNHQKTEKQLSSRLEEKKLQLEQLQLLAREWEMPVSYTHLRAHET